MLFVLLALAAGLATFAAISAFTSLYQMLRADDAPSPECWQGFVSGSDF